MIAAGTMGTTHGSLRWPRPVALELAHDAVRRRQAVGAASGEHERLNRLDLHAGPQQPYFPGSRAGTTDFDCRDVRLGKRHHGHTGHRYGVGPMAYCNAGHRGHRRVRGHSGAPRKCRGSRGPETAHHLVADRVEPVRPLCGPDLFITLTPQQNHLVAHLDGVVAYVDDDLVHRHGAGKRVTPPADQHGPIAIR